MRSCITSEISRLSLVCLTAFCLIAAPGRAVVAGHDFAYYQIILDKKPFGEVVSPQAGQAQTALSEAVSKELEMKAIVDDGTGMRVGFFDKKANKNFFLGIGENYDGIQLVSVNYDNEEAVVKRGVESALIKLHPDKDKDKQSSGGILGAPAAVPPFAPQMAAVPAASMPSPFSFTNLPAGTGSRRPFFSDLKNRRMSPFQPLGTNAMPFQGKPLDSFFKVSTGAFPNAQSPFGPFQSPQGGAAPAAFQQFIRGASNTPGSFMPVNPQQQNTPATAQGAEQLPQNQPVPQLPFQPNQYQEQQAPVESDGSDEIIQ